MPAPRTYTGEDVVELSCHGSRIILQRIVEACVAAGARVAAPGEFTRRAFMAGKMDLAQAEAVCDLIGAQGERGVRLAREQLEGRLSREVGAMASELTDLRATVEASIDLPDEGIEEAEDVLARLVEVTSGVRRLVQSFEHGRLAREGVRTVIVGRRNAGKSSLLNRLAGCERALVHHASGTTRDVVEEGVNLDGMFFRLRDTAGIRGNPSEIESLGIDRSRCEIGMADLALVVFDGSSEFSPEDAEVLKLAKGMHLVYVVNKSDLPQKFDIEELDAEPVRISALTGDGMEGLTRRMAWLSLNEGGATDAGESATVTSVRHRALLAEAAEALEGARSLIEGGAAAELAAQHLRQAQSAIGGITGEVTTDEILDRIFSRFCIGK